MKKFLAIFLVVAMMCSLCACGVKSVEVEEESRVAIGYAIVEHWDGEEHIEFYKNLTNYGTITIWTLEDQRIVSTNITLIFY
jgi:hypothetical protein